MTEDIGHRFYLAGQLNRMSYGDTRIIPARTAHKCWPPTGNEDRSMEGAFRAMALASGGNRPEEDLTTKQRIERDLDDTFVVEQRLDGDWLVSRRLSACPKCRGTGWHETASYAPIAFDADAAVSMTDTIEVVRKKCEHRYEN